MAEAFLNEHLPESLFGAPKAGPGMWASCIRVLDPSEGNTLQQICLEQNEAAVRLAFDIFLPHLMEYSSVILLKVNIN